MSHSSVTTKRFDQPRRGAVVIMFAVFLVIIIIAIAVAVDIGAVTLSRGQLHTSSDAGALAGASRLYKGPGHVRKEVKDYVERHTPYGHDKPEVKNQDIEIGTWDFEANPLVFVPRADNKGNAVRVTNRTTSSPMFFGKIFGTQNFGSTSTSVAALIPREIVFVVDCSGSMNDDTEPAWATQAIDNIYGGVGSAMRNSLRSQLNLPFAEIDLKTWIESRTYQNDIQCLPGVPYGAKVNFQVSSPEYCYAVMTMDNGVLAQPSIPSQYRITSGEGESSRHTKCYNYIREVLLRDGGLVPQHPPFNNSALSNRYWNRYIDYIMLPTVHTLDPPPGVPQMPTEPSAPSADTSHCCHYPPPPHHQPPPPHHNPHHTHHSPHSHGDPHDHHSGHHDNHHQLPHHHHHAHHETHTHGGPHGGAHSSHVPSHHVPHSGAPPHAGPNGAIQPRQEWFKEWQRGNLPTLASRAGANVEVASLEAALECVLGKAAPGLSGLHPTHFPNPPASSKAPYSPPGYPSCGPNGTVISSCVNAEISYYNAAYSAYSSAWDTWYYSSYPAWHAAYHDYYNNVLPQYLAMAKRFGSSPYQRGALPPTQLKNYFTPATVDCIADLGASTTFAFNNPNVDLRPELNNANGKAIPKQFMNKLGWQTYQQFCLDQGRDGQPAMDNTGKNGVYYTPLSTQSGVCPLHNEAVVDTGSGVPTQNISFPPAEQPMHALRRAIIRACMVMKKFNEELAPNFQDRVAIVQFDRYVTIPGYTAAPVVLQGLTNNYDTVMSSAALLQAVSDRGRSTAIEPGMITAFNHISANARKFSHKVVIVITDGVPNELQSSTGTISSFVSSMQAQGKGSLVYTADKRWTSAAFPPGDRFWFNSALMQANNMRNQPGTWDVYPVGVGMGIDTDFLLKMATIAGTEKLASQLIVQHADPNAAEDALATVFKTILDQPRVFLVQ